MVRTQKEARLMLRLKFMAYGFTLNRVVIISSISGKLWYEYCKTNILLFQYICWLLDLEHLNVGNGNGGLSMVRWFWQKQDKRKELHVVEKRLRQSTITIVETTKNQPSNSQSQTFIYLTNKTLGWWFTLTNEVVSEIPPYTRSSV